MDIPRIWNLALQHFTGKDACSWKGVGVERGNIGPRRNHEILNMAIPVCDVIVNIFKHPNFRNF